MTIEKGSEDYDWEEDPEGRLDAFEKMLFCTGGEDDTLN